MSNKLYAGLIGLVLSGCSIGTRIELFTNNFEQELNKEYRQRTDPSIIGNDKYASLRRIGELQLRVSQGLLSRREALDQITEQDYENSFDSIQAIVRSAAQDAFKLANPEVRYVERVISLDATRQPRTDISDVFSPELRLNASLSDIINPRLNLNSSVSNGQIELTPSLRLGRLYSISYSTKDEVIDHNLRYQIGRLYLQCGCEHTIRELRNIQGTASYLLNNNMVLNFTYRYNKKEEDHIFSGGFSWSF